MTDADRGRFVDEIMSPLFLSFREKPDEALPAVYFTGLADLDFDTVRRAMHLAIRTLTFFPKVAELRTLALGGLEQRAALAWARVYNACGTGYYQPITFEDGLIHAVIAAMGGWSELYSLGFAHVEAVDVATKRKEFLQLYAAYAHRGVPPTTPLTLCAGPASVRDEAVLRIGPAGEIPALAPGEEPKALPAAPLADYGQRLEAIAGDIGTKYALPMPVRRVVVDRPVKLPPTAEEIAEHERKKAQAREKLAALESANGSPA